MAETLVEDGSTYPASITVPEDGDARNAASVVVGFQGLADRLKYLYTGLAPWIIGGTLTIANDLILALDSAKTLTFTGGPLDFTAANRATFAGNIRGHLFDGTGSLGRANARVNVITPGAGTTAVDPTFFDELFVDESAGCTIQLTVSPGEAYVRGDRITVHHGSIFSVLVKDPGGTTLATLANANEYVELIYTGSAWRTGKFKIA